MALKKWGEIRNERGYIGAVVGGIVIGVIAFLITPPNFKLFGIFVGFLVGFAIGHAFDSAKTIIYKEEDENK